MLQLTFDDAAPVIAEPARAEVRVVRSRKRRKTVSGRVVGGVIQVSIPDWMSAAEERDAVDSMVTRLQQKRSRGAADIDLTARAARLAGRFGLRTPRVIRWVDNQTTRWGSCTPATGTIRISTALAAFPDWVLDYVLVHELAHLHVHGHGPEFWALVNRYPKTERARGFLIAKGIEESEGDGEGDGDG